MFTAVMSVVGKARAVLTWPYEHHTDHHRALIALGSEKTCGDVTAVPALSARLKFQVTVGR